MDTNLERRQEGPTMGDWLRLGAALAACRIAEWLMEPGIRLLAYSQRVLADSNRPRRGTPSTIGLGVPAHR